MILVIGNSQHLSEAICSAYPGHEIKVIPWRSQFHEMEMTPYDLVFIVGFDYSSYMMRYNDYMDVNMVQPMLAVQRFAKPTADKIYIATQNGNKNYTFSRYRYAKEKLGLTLVSQCANSYVIRFDTFATQSQQPLVKGGFFTQLIFSSLAKLGVVKTVDMQTVSNQLKAYKSSCTNDLRDIKGILVTMPRPQFFDRLMRLLIA